MDWSITLLILAIAGLAIIFVIGGKISVKPTGVEINTDGLLKYLREAEKKKNIVASSDDQKIVIGHLKGRLPLGSILWVDDHALNNQDERLALANIGVFVDAYTDNQQALEALKAERYDLIISDIGRNIGRETGWDLLTAVRKEKKDIPFIFYTSKKTVDIEAKAQQLGANSVEDLPKELIASVIKRLTPNITP